MAMLTGCVCAIGGILGAGGSGISVSDGRLAVLLLAKGMLAVGRCCQSDWLLGAAAAKV